jgi:hypothetical protein
MAIAFLGASAVIADAQPAAKAPKPAAATTAASTGGATGDVRCLLTMVALRGQKDQQAAQQGVLGVFFFAGRVSTHGPTLDLASAFKTQAPTLTQTQLQAELQRCAPIIQTSLQGVQAALSALRPPGAPPPGAPSSAAPAGPAPLAPPAPQPH